MKNNQQKNLHIYNSINGFLNKCLHLKDSRLLQRYLSFMKKVPNHAPFNNTLVFIQNPNCTYYATSHQWGKRFNRTIKMNARPMVILFPFGPIEFVYNLEDTEGEDISETRILKWWRQNGGMLDDRIIENTQRNLENFDIHYIRLKAKEYFKEVNFTTAGYAQRNLRSDELSITLHPRYNEKSVESYGILCHEIAHILLGHLGRITVKRKNKGISKNRDNLLQNPTVFTSENVKEIARDRSFLPRNVREIEAELVAWIVFNSLGIEKNSEAYIATWIVKQEYINNISLSDVLKVAGKIQDMGRRVFK